MHSDVCNIFKSIVTHGVLAVHQRYDLYRDSMIHVDESYRIGSCQIRYLQLSLSNSP